MADTEFEQLAKTNRNPVQETRYQELLRQQPQGSQQSSASDPQAAIDAAIKRMQEANRPAVQSLESSIPEVQNKYATTRQQLQAREPSLQERYKNLISDIRGRGEADVNAQTRITSSELGKRGLTSDSTLAQQELQNSVSPLRQKYTSLEKDAALSQEDELRSLRDAITNLTPMETADMRSIQNAIAQLQSGAASQGVTQGLNLYQMDLQRQMQERQFAEEQKARELQQQLAQASAAQKQYMTLGEGQTVFDPTTGRVVLTTPKTYKESGGGGMTAQDLLRTLGQSKPTQTTQPAQKSRYTIVG